MAKKNNRPYIVPLVSEIDAETFADVQVNVLEAAAAGASLVVRICSRGGEAAAGFAIYDLLSATPGVITEAWGECDSVAALILMAGSVRRASRNSRIMIHNSASHIGHAVLGKEDFLRHGQEHLRLDETYAKIIATRSGLPLGKVEHWNKSETFFSAEEALTVGLIDEIVGA